jgi:hypothetical protein
MPVRILEAHSAKCPSAGMRVADAEFWYIRQNGRLLVKRHLEADHDPGWAKAVGHTLAVPNQFRRRSTSAVADLPPPIQCSPQHDPSS